MSSTDWEKGKEERIKYLEKKLKELGLDKYQDWLIEQFGLKQTKKLKKIKGHSHILSDIHIPHGESEFKEVIDNGNEWLVNEKTGEALFVSNHPKRLEAYINKQNQEWIERRIKDEYRKHKTLDWARLASIKINKEIKRKYDLK